MGRKGWSRQGNIRILMGIWDDGIILVRVGRVRVKNVGVGGGYCGDGVEKPVGCQEFLRMERLQVEKIFFGLRPVHQRGGSIKNVCTQKIVEWRRRETIVEKILFLCSFNLLVKGN